MEYAIWNRSSMEDEAITTEAAQEIISPAPYHTGPYGQMGDEIDLVLYEEEALPVVKAVRYGGVWYLIPSNQIAFMEHELASRELVR